MSCSKRCSLLSAFLVVAAAMVSSPDASAVARVEYFTEVEIDMIRDAQELKTRMPVLLRIAERRLVALELLVKKDGAKMKPRKDEDGVVIDDTKEFAEFTRSEWIRGYTQVLDEVMSNIDDAFTRKFEVRDALEDLAKFTEETLPLLKKFEPKTREEREAAAEAAEKAGQAMQGAKEAMQKVPKTEKKRK